ncbi:MAG: Rieske (2Fe-2S) protein, partial [Rivularia sp. ALOHA_DT_140]|nr:Rieske (2Fe-2S) protein [Rivularia sp. ALOHA_DT_140]
GCRLSRTCGERLSQHSCACCQINQNFEHMIFLTQNTFARGLMIPNQWYAVIESKKISSKKPLGLRRFGEKIVLWRNERGEVVCFPDRCSRNRWFLLL